MEEMSSWKKKLTWNNLVFLDADNFNLKTSKHLSFKLIRNSKKVVGECRLGEEEGKEGQKVLHYNFLLWKELELRRESKNS